MSQRHFISGGCVLWLPDWTVLTLLTNGGWLLVRGWHYTPSITDFRHCLRLILYWNGPPSVLFSLGILSNRWWNVMDLLMNWAGIFKTPALAASPSIKSNCYAEFPLFLLVKIPMISWWNAVPGEIFSKKWRSHRVWPTNAPFCPLNRHLNRLQFPCSSHL